MRATLRAGVLVVLLAAAMGGDALHYSEMPEEWRQPRDLDHPLIPRDGAPPDDEYRLREGFTLELVASGLTYPTMVAWDEAGRLLVAESGYSYGPSTAIPRILAVDEDVATREVARLPDGPVTSIAFHDGTLYALGGRDPARLWSVDIDNGEVETVVSGFPVWGRHFTSDLAFDDDAVYFAVGDPTNSGVLGLDDYFTYGYLSIFPAARSIPCIPLQTQDLSFETSDPYHPHPDAKTRTGPYQRFGQPAPHHGNVSTGEAPACNGAVFRAALDGSSVEVFASGLRHVHGLGFAPDGRLLAVEEGMKPTGSRPVADVCDPLWEIEEDAWYGFPDHACGRPVTDDRHIAENRSRPQTLLRDGPPFDRTPVHEFTPNSGTRHFAFDTEGAFGTSDALYVAQYGSHFEWPPEGHRVVRLDLDTGNEDVLYENLLPGIEGSAPERPTAVRFGPDGALYVVDFGKLTTTTKTFHPSALTGAIWRIAPTDEGTNDDGE